MAPVQDTIQQLEKVQSLDSVKVLESPIGDPEKLVADVQSVDADEGSADVIMNDQDVAIEVTFRVMDFVVLVFFFFLYS
jgi:hypothetical protein